MLRRASLRANARQVNTLRPHVVEMSKRYPTLDLPVELVHGDTDDTVPLDIHSQPLSALLPDANLTVLPGIGHMPHHVAPEAVTAAIDRAARRAGISRPTRFPRHSLSVLNWPRSALTPTSVPPFAWESYFAECSLLTSSGLSMVYRIVAITSARRATRARS